jgi:hypothetical protein
MPNLRMPRVKRQFSVVVAALAGLLGVSINMNAAAAVAPPVSTRVDAITEADPCPPNSGDATVTGPVGKSQCVAEMPRSTRSGLIPACVTAEKTGQATDPWYEPRECRGGRGIQAEAIAQARALAKLNAAGVFGETKPRGEITANLQWEVTAGRRVRIDILAYDRNALSPADSPIKLIELKQEIYGGNGAADTALLTYEEQFPGGPGGRDVERYDFSSHPYDDAFRVWTKKCTEGAPNNVVLQYRVRSTATLGVLVVGSPVRDVTPCEGDDDIPEKVTLTEDTEDHDHDPRPRTFRSPRSDDDGDGKSDMFEDFYDAHPELHDLEVPAPEPALPHGVTVSVSALAEAAMVAMVELAESLSPSDAAALLGNAASWVKDGALNVAAIVRDLTLNSLENDFTAVWGEPHIATLDHLAYDLQAVGEFELLQAPEVGLDVQARFAPINANTSVLDRVATEVGESIVEVGIGDVKVDGETVSLPSGGLVELDEGATLARHDGTYVLTWPHDDELLSMTVTQYTVGFSVPTNMATRGLLGNHNGESNDDLALSDGTTLPADSSATVIHDAFADSWRVTQDDSLFTYGPGESTDTFTDRSFPSNIITIGDFTEAEIAAASTVCVNAGVVPGPQFEDCVFDVAVTGDEDYAEAAASATEVLVDPHAHAFDSSGTLSEDFEGTVGPNFASPNYSEDASTSRVAGPLFDSPGYRMFARDVPRHDRVRLRTDLLTYGPVGSDAEPQNVEIRVDDAAVGVVSFDEGDEPTLNSDFEGSIERTGVGLTSGGESFTRYSLDLWIEHATPTLDIELRPSNFRGLLNTSLGVDDIVLDLDTPPADEFDVALSATIPGPGASQAAGAGRLETPGSEDVYNFTLTDDAERGLVIDHSDCVPGLVYTLEDVTAGTTIQRFSTCLDKSTDPLPAGDYALTVTGTAASYVLELLVSPEPETFTYEVGTSVSDGVPAAGAGNLETVASQDVYDFTVPAGGLTLQYDHLSGSMQYTLTSVETGERIGGSEGYSDQQFDLPAGDYQIAFSVIFDAGPYSFKMFEVPAPQTFAYELGTTVSNGVPAAGAGNLETVASEDRYTFTVPAGGATLLYEGLAGYKIFTLVDLATGQILGSGSDNKGYELPAGDYRLDFKPQSNTGTYSFTLMEVPDPQTFAYELGTTVSDGVPAAGAGNLETLASEDRYTFTVPTGGLVLQYDNLGVTTRYTLVDLTRDETVATGADDQRFPLPAGDYRLEFPHQEPGTYSFTMFEVPAPQTFAYELGTTVSNGVPAAGAGNLETNYSQDQYTFTVPVGGQVLQYDSIAGSKSYTLIDDATGETVDSGVGDIQFDLPASQYRLEIGPESTGTYSFRLFEVPAPQTFAYGLGTTVSDGVPAAGAGNLETNLSEDLYTFTIPAGGALVQYDTVSGSKSYRLVDAATDEVVGSGVLDKQYELPAGDYRLEFRPQSAGTYSFTLFEVPAPQTFAYELGTTVSDGVPAAGAGNLETVASEDRYTFTVPAGGASVQYDSITRSMVYSLVDLATGEVLASGVGDKQYQLPAGEYRLDFKPQSAQGAYSFALIDATPQTFAYELGSTVSDGVPAAGAGNLETNFSQDRYTFTIPSGGKVLQYDAIMGSKSYKLVDAATDEIVDSGIGDKQFDLPEGDYRLEFRQQSAGAYSFTLIVAPDPQTFAYELGTTVSDGVPAAGAGNLETNLSEDRYTFTIPSGGAVLQYDWVSGSRTYTLVNAATGATIGSGITDKQYVLPAGDYRLEFRPQFRGAYSFTLFVVGEAT